MISMIIAWAISVSLSFLSWRNLYNNGRLPAILSYTAGYAACASLVGFIAREPLHGVAYLLPTIVILISSLVLKLNRKRRSAM